MKKILGAVLLVVAVGFTGCEEEVTAPTPTVSNYFPMTQGSTWTYNQTNDFFPGIETETKTISGDTTVNGRKFVKILSTDSLSTPEFMRRSNDTVFALEDGVEMIRAIERKGATWTIVTDDDEDGSTNVTFTVMDKGISRTVEGKVYADVLHIHAAGTMTMDGTTIPVEMNGYLAKGVGIIEENLPFGTSTLKSYTIK